MDQVNGFERANHDSEFGNPAIRAVNIKSFLMNNARDKLVKGEKRTVKCERQRFK
jgi:hypothetical protein